MIEYKIIKISDQPCERCSGNGQQFIRGLWGDTYEPCLSCHGTGFGREEVPLWEGLKEMGFKIKNAGQ